jgi:hypothetical protein
MLSNEIEDWKKKHPFLESLIENAQVPIFSIHEEESTQRIFRECKTRGYDCTQGESTCWQWYGIEDNKIKELEGIFVREALAKGRFDYIISVDDITTDIFEDRTISIYQCKK